MGLDMYLCKTKKVYDEKTGERIKLEKLCPETLMKKNPELYKSLKPYEVTRGKYFQWQDYSEEVGYWRKANQVHAWFVDNVQNGVDDCDSYVVTAEKLEELLEICQRLLTNLKLKDGMAYNGEHFVEDEDGKLEPVKDYRTGKVISNPELAEELLPTQGGFFFGNVDYDEDYYADIADTVKIITKVLHETDWENEIIHYHSSW